MTVNKAIEIINKAEQEWYRGPNYKKKNNLNFTYQSYSRWAVEEIKSYILLHPDTNPLDTIEEFRYKMDDYSCSAKTPEASFMFSVACDVAIDIYDILSDKNRGSV